MKKYSLNEINEIVNNFLIPANSVELILNSYSPTRSSILIEEINFVFKCAIHKSIFIDQIVYPNGLVAMEINSNVSKEINNIEDALKILKNTRTFIRRALKDYISEIYVITTTERHFEISSSPKNLYGTFVMCANNPILIAESIVHETCHNILEAYNDQHHLFDNSKECVYKSAWRSDLRPIQGVYHATYVFYHICKFYREFINLINLKEAAFDISYSKNLSDYIEYVKYNEARILESITNIFEDSNLTVLGKKLLQKIKKNILISHIQ